MTDQHLNSTELNQLITIFHKLTGIKYSEEKLYLFENRLSKYLLPVGRFSNYSGLISELANNQQLQKEVINSLTTNYTFFFRELKHFRFLQYISNNKFLEAKEIRLWSAAASGGHEAYSMAISLLGRHSGLNRGFRILGTDIATDKIDFARRGIYDKDEIEGHINKEAINKYFLRSGDSYIVKESVKQYVKFAPLNIMGVYPFKKNFHIVFLRNILIYFKPEEKEIILNKISHYMEPDGYLVISLSESLTGLKVPFKHINSGIYQLTNF